MTPGADGVTRVRLADLDLGPELGDGGEGRVTEVRVAGAEGGPALVAKTYAVGLSERRSAHLAHLVRLAPHLVDAVHPMAWPQALVVDGDRTVGVLLPRAPDAFWATFTLRSGRTQQRLREVQYLLFPQAKLERLGLPFAGLSERLAVLGAVTAAIQTLHGLGLVYGDLSARNILWGVPSAAYLLDCDGVAVRGAEHTIGSPDWNDPSAPTTAQPSADIYKLGLLITRMLTLNPTTRRAPAPGGAPDVLAPVLRRMLDPEAAQRPGVDEVTAALDACLPGPVAAGAQPPTWGMRPGTGELVLMGGAPAGDVR